MTLSAAQDIDFIMWGPFPNLLNAVANCNSYSAADIVPDLPAGCGGFLAQFVPNRDVAILLQISKHLPFLMQ